MKFILNHKCEDSFKLLNEFLTCAPILRILDLDKEYVVCIYASLEGLGGILIQDGHVICYESWKVNENEKNYSTHDL